VPPAAENGFELLQMPPEPEHFGALMRRWGLARTNAEAPA
jgi:hypothetical protein